jgi:hypothetical protein
VEDVEDVKRGIEARPHCNYSKHTDGNRKFNNVQDEFHFRSFVRCDPKVLISNDFCIDLLQ